MAENPFAQFVEAEEEEEPKANPFSTFVEARENVEPPAEDPNLEKVAPRVYRYTMFGRTEVDPNAPPSDPGAFQAPAEALVGAGEVAASIGSSVLAEPVAGLAGMYTGATEGAEAGAEQVEATREAMTYQPGTETGKEMMGDVGSFLAPMGEGLTAVETGLGEATLEATGSPGLAAAAHAIPTALMETLGLGLLRRPSKAAQRAAKAQERVRLDDAMTPEQRATELIEPEMRSHEQIAQSLREKTDISEDVIPDQEILDAAEALGVDLNPSHYSTNEAYRRVEQAVKSQPKSRILAAREAEAITRLGEKADELVGEFGGSLDKSLLDTKVRARLDGTIADLRKSTKNIYARVARKIEQQAGKAPKVNARASKAYLDARLEQMGGDVSGLSKAEKQLHQVLNQERPPTYARLNQLRQDVGAAYRRQGPFADDVSGNLDQVYKAVITDQQGFAKAMGAGPEFAAGRKMVQARKDLEAQAMQMFGRDLNKSFLPQLTQSATALTKGQVQKFKNLMDALPEDMRTPAAATMLNDLFTHGTRKGGSLGGGFASAYRALNVHKGAKAEIFKYLPKAAQRRFDAIGTVSEGIYRAKALENTSKTARDILEALESGGMVARISDKASDTILGRMTFVPGPTRWIASAAKASKSVAKEAFDNVRAADNLMSSNEFSRSIAMAMEGRVKEAEIMLKRSATWRAFRNTLGEGTKTQLAAMGPIAWLTQQDEQAAPAAPTPGVAPVDPASPGMPPVGPPPEVFPGGQ